MPKVIIAMDTVPPVIVEPVIWQPDRVAKKPSWPVPTTGVALLRGLRCVCPACGETKLFRGYLRVADSCPSCQAPLGRIRADDAPPYFTIFIVAHIVVGGMVGLNRSYDLSDMTQALIWLPVSTVLVLGLLRPIKGATVGLMLRLGLVNKDG
jgi:uncharacterized protein (DUF983 family)